ncbi:Aspartyl protease [Singulisphaera sp. GP187]|uniref:aspartyl protease family protein n=1 Tax=Singulisphaera sp. GP187 TaxID=1882752 RepID=UPI000927143A|nr:aspartyl protease family protein [Singulisphaera sp. GP187]SIN69458.1 Aspartyl protease [Singulisphaera sp. GP187]
MKSTVFNVLMFCLLASTVFPNPVTAQQDIPILKSRSKVITIVDGDHVKSNHWTLMPERHPDIYYVELPMKPHSVTFRSDIDSITFSVNYGDQYDFAILLNDKVVCATQVRAAYRKLQPYSRTASDRPATGITIPFSLGDNDKIYIKARLNKGKFLDFQFDLGCGGSVIKKSSVLNANMQFDGTANLINSDGNNVVPSSSTNHLQIEHLHWDGLPFVVGDNMTRREDGLLGNALFQDKVIEINYDRKVLVVHDFLPPIDSKYSKHKMILDGVVPFIQGTLSIADEQRKGWFMFDTGAYTSILSSNKMSPGSKLFDELQKLLWNNQATSSAPRLSVGDHAFAGFNYSIRNHEGDDDRLGLLGNDILKRFNVILDNQNGLIYLQPNTLARDPFRNPEYYLARVIVIFGLLLIAASGWFIYRRQHKRGRKDGLRAVE